MPIPEHEFEQTIITQKRSNETASLPEAVGHYLVVVKGVQAGSRVEVGAEPVTIGRDPQRTLVLADSGISRLHARVSILDDLAVLEDAGSTNGTFLDGKRVTSPMTLKEGSLLGLGSHTLKYERRSRSEVERARELDRDLRQAGDYVLSLLPAPLTEGPVLACWSYVPSTQLGGDAFGYYWLDPDTFVFYLLDVTGHGVGSAMHSVTVLNVLRQRALPHVDFTDPASVLSSLNNRFQMDSHHGMLFTMWYGVFNIGTRVLTFGSAGHHSAYLVPFDKRGSSPLGMPALMIGAMPDVEYEVRRATLPAQSSLYLFSDGVFEIVVADGRRWTESDFEPLLLEPSIPGVTESERLYRAVKKTMGSRPLEDDASLLVLSFQ